MSFVYNHAKLAAANGAINYATDDLRVLLVMANSTADADTESQYVGNIATLDEMDGSGYARQALGTQTTAVEHGSNRAKFDADDADFGAVANGTREVKGAIIYKHAGADDAANPVIAYIDDGGFPFSPGGSNVKIQWNAAGIKLWT